MQRDASSDTTANGGVATEIARTIALRDREDMLRRVQMTNEHSASPDTLAQETALQRAVAADSPEVATPTRVDYRAAHALVRFARDAHRPLSMADVRVAGFALPVLNGVGLEVVCVLPGWYAHRALCTDASKAQALVSAIARHYDAPSWNVELRRCCVQPMLCSCGELQNLRGWQHLSVACMYMAHRASGQGALEACARALTQPPLSLPPLSQALKDAAARVSTRTASVVERLVRAKT